MSATKETNSIQDSIESNEINSTENILQLIKVPDTFIKDELILDEFVLICMRNVRTWHLKSILLWQS